MAVSDEDLETRAKVEMVGGCCQIAGVVEHGDERGRQLGFPTANLAPGDDADLLVDGVYAGWCWRANGTVWPTAVSVGRRPTFYRDEPVSLLVEAYLLDFQGSLYDERITVRLVRRLRGQVRFDGVDQLVAQLARDVERTRRLLVPAGDGGNRGVAR